MQDLSLIKLILDASLAVQMVMLLLLVISILSWFYIFKKYTQLQTAQKKTTLFEKRFWTGNDLSGLYTEIIAKKNRLSGMESVFVSGFKEYARQRKQSGVDPMAVIEGVQRTMRASLNREIDILEEKLSFLATVASVSPYIGLFGTVWGIMNSFRSLSNVHQATLSAVAPGIAEALIATALGLFAAIPAVIAYNSYVDTVERLISRYTAFSEEFATILQRQAHL